MSESWPPPHRFTLASTAHAKIAEALSEVVAVRVSQEQLWRRFKDAVGR